jgi:hypothetical protein
LEEIMERVLQDVNAVVGVTGTFVCNSEGTLVARALPSVFDEGSFLPAARTILQTIEGLETTRRRRVHEIDLVFGEGRMVVKNLLGGAESTRSTWCLEKEGWWSRTCVLAACTSSACAPSMSLF